MDLTPADRQALINDIASRAGTAKQIALWYGVTTSELREFVEDNQEDIKLVRDEMDQHENDTPSIEVVTPADLEELWISKKIARLARYEKISDALYAEAIRDPTDATVLRELRSYMVAAANELGQLMHRGAGDAGSGEALSVDFNGIDLETLK